MVFVHLSKIPRRGCDLGENIAPHPLNTYDSEAWVLQHISVAGLVEIRGFSGLSSMFLLRVIEAESYLYVRDENMNKSIFSQTSLP